MDMENNQEEGKKKLVGLRLPCTFLCLVRLSEAKPQIPSADIQDTIGQVRGYSFSVVLASIITFYKHKIETRGMIWLGTRG